MSRFYGIFIKGKPNNILDLTKLSNFERTSNYRSIELYTLKDLIKLTTKYDSEIAFKLDLFRNGVITLEDITKNIVIRSCGNSKDDKRLGKPKDIIYKSCIELFKPSVLKEVYLNKTDISRNYNFLLGLVSEFRTYGNSSDIGKYTSEIFIDEIKSILIYYNQNPNYDCTKQLKIAMNNFINHEIYYVIGENTPNGYDREIKYKYRTDDKTGSKLINLHAMYELVLFYIHNSGDNRFINNNISVDELNSLKQDISGKTYKSKSRKRKINDIEGQMKIGDN